MTKLQQYIAVDLGAESGRVILGTICDDRLDIEQIHRFANGPIEEKGSLRWDFSKLLCQIKIGIAKAVKKANTPISGIGVDSWGVDFGLIDPARELIENPYHYRDSRTDGMMKKAFEFMDERDIYKNTGIQFMQLNTIFQLLAMRLADSDTLGKAEGLTFIADMVSYHLCKKMYAEYTLASTSQLMDMKSGQWSKEIFAKLQLPLNIMPQIIESGTVVGTLTEEMAKELDCEQISLIATGSHDTASAVAAVPAGENNWAYLSSGTWSLMGVEIDEPIINDKTFEYSFTNEGGVEGTIRLLKNIMGLWPVQECKRQWQREGIDLSYPQITEMAGKAEPFAATIDVDDQNFIHPGSMLEKINNHLIQTAQQPISDKGQLIRGILESLALKYRWTIEKIEEITGNSIDCLHIVGGGIQNELLCQFTANAIAKKVITGPIEATAAGNILIQARAAGQIESLSQARQIVRNSFELKEYQPQDTKLWQKQYEKIKSRQ